MGFEDFEPIIGEPKPEWWKNSVSGSPPPRRFMMHVYAPDYYHLNVQVTDFHSNTFGTVKSVVQLEDLRDSMGIGGSWSDFVDYLIASVKSDNVKLVLEKYSDSDDAANAKFFAQKSKGMPLIHISLAKLQNTAASDAMSEISFGLFRAYKSMQSSVSQEKEHSLQLTTLVSAEKEKSENIQSELERRLKSSDKQDVSASLASNGVQGSPGVSGIPIPSNDPKNLDQASRTNQEKCTVQSGCFANSQSVSYSTQPRFENIVLVEEPVAEIVDKRQPWRWSIDEEKKLVSAWLTIANDRVEGTAQIDRPIWKPVTEYFNANRKTVPQRKMSSVKHHWFWMLPLVNEFHQLYDKLLEEHRSSWSDDQLKQRARELYYQQRKKHFLHEHVWVMLKDHLKWKTNTLPSSSKKAKINESGDYTCSSNAETSLEVEDNEVEVCPISQKADKTEVERKGKSRVIDKRIEDEMQKLIEWRDLKLAEIGNMKQPSETLNDHRILTMDTSQMNTEQLENHRFMCSVIKSKYNTS